MLSQGRPKKVRDFDQRSFSMNSMLTNEKYGLKREANPQISMNGHGFHISTMITMFFQYSGRLGFFQRLYALAEKSCPWQSGRQGQVSGDWSSEAGLIHSMSSKARGVWIARKENFK